MITSTSTLSHLRTAAATALAGVLLLGVAPAEAVAKPQPQIGPVTGLGLSVTPGDGYRVDARWDALPRATRYAVKLVDGSNTRLAAGSVSTPTWGVSTTAPAGTRLTVTVTPYVDSRRGKPASVSQVLPDVTPPTAAYSVVRDAADPSGGSVTIRRDRLSDDLTPLAGITQTITWGAGLEPQPWAPAQTEISHDYGDAEALHRPVVTVRDAAGNTASHELAVPVRDAQAPTGSYAVSGGSAFARWTPVQLTELAAADNLSDAADLVRTVDWGDGSTETWNPGLTHVYAAAGSFTPRVRLTDEAGNTSAWTSATVVDVVADTAAPTTTLRVPARATRASSWSTLRGVLDDGAGVGARATTVRVAQLRRGAWYAYRAPSRTWVRAAGRNAALTAARGTARPSATDRWALPVSGLRNGTLVVRYRGADLLGNTTATFVRSQVLTSR